MAAADVGQSSFVNTWQQAEHAERAPPFIIRDTLSHTHFYSHVVLNESVSVARRSKKDTFSGIRPSAKVL